MNGSLSGRNYSQVSMTVFSILADFKNAVVMIGYTTPFISKSSTPCYKPLVTLPRTPITTGIPVIFIVFFSVF